jgi:hypothetical protein
MRAARQGWLVCSYRLDDSLSGKERQAVIGWMQGFVHSLIPGVVDDLPNNWITVGDVFTPLPRLFAS